MPVIRATCWISLEFKLLSFGWNLQIHGAGREGRSPHFQAFAFIKEVQTKEVTCPKWKARSPRSEPRGRFLTPSVLFVKGFYEPESGYGNTWFWALVLKVKASGISIFFYETGNYFLETERDGGIMIFAPMKYMLAQNTWELRSK